MSNHPASSVREATSALAALRAVFAEQAVGGANQADYMTLLAEIETTIRQLQATQYDAMAAMETMADDSLGGVRVCDAIADKLRIRRTDARVRMATAEVLADRLTMQGEALPPKRENLAKLAHAGIIGTDHLKVAKDFFRHLPRKTDPLTVSHCEAELAEYAQSFRPDEMEKLAKALLNAVNPDGTLEDEQDRANKRYFLTGRQTADKMVSGRFCFDPATAAAIEAWLAKFAAPGMCDPADADPVIAGQPDESATLTDRRSYGQRCHDAIAMLVRNGLSDEKIGQHRGLPATIVITADIKDLDPSEGTSGLGRTGGGLRIPISDVLKLAGHARHYLALFDDAKPVELFHGRDRRLASVGQRLVLHASEGGCSFPSCDRGAYFSQVHHLDEWVLDGQTNIDVETLACDVHHPCVGPGKWQTRKNADGITEWIPPPHLDPDQHPRINKFHRPDLWIRLRRTKAEE